MTDNERRRIAKRLRIANVHSCNPDCELHFALSGDNGCGKGGCSECRRDAFSRLADLIEPEKITGETSDGYHTFDELYDHRAKLFSVIVRDHRELAWKSKLHHDGTMYDGMFVVGIEAPDGQATYHYDVDPYWDLFDCKELDRAPEWDGHTPQQAIDRIAALRPSCDREALLELAGLLEREAEAMRSASEVGEQMTMRLVRKVARTFSLVAEFVRSACGEARAEGEFWRCPFTQGPCDDMCMLATTVYATSPDFMGGTPDVDEGRPLGWSCTLRKDAGARYNAPRGEEA